MNRFQPDALVLVVHSFQQRVDQLGWCGLRPRGQRPGLEGAGRTAAVPNLHQEADALAIGNLLDQEERELGGYRLNLDLVQRIVDERRNRHDGLGVLRFAEQAQRARAHFCIGIPQVAHDVVESLLLGGGG